MFHIIVTTNTEFCLFICMFVFASNSGHFQINKFLLFLAPLLLNYFNFCFIYFYVCKKVEGGRAKAVQPLPVHCPWTWQSRKTMACIGQKYPKKLPSLLTKTKNQRQVWRKSANCIRHENQKNTLCECKNWKTVIRTKNWPNLSNPKNPNTLFVVAVIGCKSNHIAELLSEIVY